MYIKTILLFGRGRNHTHRETCGSILSLWKGKSGTMRILESFEDSYMSFVKSETEEDLGLQTRAEK